MMIKRRDFCKQTMETDPSKNHDGLFVYGGVVLCIDSINGGKSDGRDLHSGDRTAGRERGGGIEPDGKGVGRMSVKEILKDLGWCVLCALPIMAYAMFFYFI